MACPWLGVPCLIIFNVYIWLIFYFPHCCLYQALAVSDHFPVEVNLIAQELAA